MSIDVDAALAAAPVMVIIRNETPERTAELCDRAWDLGVQVVEVPIQAPDAVPSLEAAVAAAHARGLEVGAGSIHTLEQWDAAIAAGAAFTVAAATVPAVIERAVSRGIVHIPGVATGTEVATALASGARWLKAFPASVLTPEWVKAVRAPFPAASFVATGGVTAQNAQDFFDAGCRVVAFGSSFDSPESAAAIRGILDRAA
ncbi:bifunctional 4-hydroxy-2-oxoglutarate aldolase/2-dehydro-3-deoxy-phosphogluconate aldolase [Microbacterium ulmi]|uniref:Bifunctional 4-hydroxy-2-oxoglutarate aldolase/2-dehydro-3-deoxy-phosphogluconate aldolase n=1 Tax=Microbacterium ulmi TaxID=179095 RepID=A0A7Y2PZL0_9MICO|nr:bifunctional 4-hydroxy-2-oxoglutarate aldolase/2-dehydro-3-deoxy-phosphogluconate aldolase [Microbacterium ulmi]NII69999.1 2-dehydro-3-deoxyphosphogluconate aldolase/(4S)-4-hydroxy-2-oxoglutarate aldolase [Microbacterium ulmi]NNH04571.1 bifunctional 4-hydroxy-2-oxoglutarate aldolase/2-dehydro-3-deoxy-phosphogluconate aldolase [Microbacterium ulmi]